MTRVVRYGGGWTNYVHAGCSLCAAQSADGDKLATSATHGQCLIRDANTGATIVRLNGHWNSVGAIAWAPRDHSIATACSDGTARIWDPVTGKERFALAHKMNVTGVAYMEDGQTLVTSCGDGQVRYWSTESGDQTSAVVVSKHSIRAVAPAPSGKLIAAVAEGSSRDQGDLVLLSRDAVLSRVPIDLAKGKSRPRWTSDGGRVAVPTKDTVRIYEIRNRQLIEQDQIRPPAPPLSADWNPDSKSIGIGCENGIVYLARLESPEVEQLAAHEDWIWDVEWHPKKSQVITVGADGVVGVWDPSTKKGQRLGRYSRGVSAADWSPDCALIVSSTADGNYCLWDVEKRRGTERPAHRNWIRAMRFDHTGKRMFTASQDGTIAFWSMPDGKATHDPVDLKIGALWAGTWTHDGKVAVVSDRGELCIVDPETPDAKLIYTVEKGKWLRGISWASDGSAAAVASYDSHTVHLIEPNRSGAKRWSHEFNSPCFSCAFSNDNNRIAVALADGTIRILDARDGRELFTFRGHDSQAWSVAFAPDGQSLASAGADATVRIWRMGSPTPVRIFSAPTSCIGVRFSPRGEILFGSSGAWSLDPVSAESEPGPQPKTLTDTPVGILDGPTKADLLGRRSLVEELSFFLHRAAQHSRESARTGELPNGFVLHIGGRWGSGKTSLVKQLVERVGKETTNPEPDVTPTLRHWDEVYFSAWAAASIAPAWWSIAMAVRERVLGKMGPIGRFGFRLKEAHFRFPSLGRRLFIALFALTLVAAAYWFVGRPILESIILPLEVSPSEAPPPAASAVTAIGTTADLVAIGGPITAGMILLGNAFRRARRRWRWPRRESVTSDLDTDVNFSELPRRYLTWLRRQLAHDLLLIVDDLDRCRPEFVAETLSAIHIMAALEPNPMHSADAPRGGVARLHSHAKPQPALAILLVAERKWLESSIEKHLGHTQSHAGPGKGFGAEFLEKIFVASLEIPRLQARQRETLVQASVGDGHRQTAQVALTGPTHPIHPDASKIAQLRRELQALENADLEAEARLHRRVDVEVGDPANRDMMHLEIARRTNDPRYRAAAETRVLADYAHLMDATPRGVKRTLITFWLNRALLVTLESPERPSDESIMRWTILTIRWPTLADDLSSTNTSQWRKNAESALGVDADEFLKVVDGLNIETIAKLVRA